MVGRVTYLKFIGVAYSIKICLERNDAAKNEKYMGKIQAKRKKKLNQNYCVSLDRGKQLPPPPATTATDCFCYCAPPMDCIPKP